MCSESLVRLLCVYACVCGVERVYASRPWNNSHTCGAALRPKNWPEDTEWLFFFFSRERASLSGLWTALLVMPSAKSESAVDPLEREFV